MGGYVGDVPAAEDMRAASGTVDLSDTRRVAAVRSHLPRPGEPIGPLEQLLGLTRALTGREAAAVVLTDPAGPILVATSGDVEIDPALGQAVIEGTVSAGAPLVTDDGSVIGALVVAGPAGGRSALTEDALDAMARQVVTHLRLGAELRDADEREQLRVTNERLRAANAFQQDVVAIAGHELRSPLMTLQGSIDALRQQWESLDAARRLELLAVAERSVGRIGDVAQDLYRVAETASAAVHAEAADVELGGLIRQVVADSGLEDVRVVCEEPVRAWVTARHVVQIVSNLVANAGWYGRPPIVVTAQQAGRHAVVTVDDEGDGVDAELAGRLFGRYERRPRDGGASTGLGLAIVAALAGANGGDVGYERRHPAGSRFTVTLPAAP